MTEAQAKAIARLCNAKGLHKLEVIPHPGILHALPDGYIVAIQIFEGGREIEYGISPLGQASS